MGALLCWDHCFLMSLSMMWSSVSQCLLGGLPETIVKSGKDLEDLKGLRTTDLELAVSSQVCR